jgi:vacuolar protein sorting-associated protein 53
MQAQLMKDDKLMYLPTDHTRENQEDESESGFLKLANNVVSGGISSVFDKFLGSYVLLEKHNLDDMLAKLSAADDVTGEGKTQQSGNVYASASSMFVFIKNSIKRCIALTTGQTFFALSQEFRVCMQNYIAILKSRAPAEVSTTPLLYRLPPGTEISLCFLINTGEYCAEVAPQLEQMIQQKIQPSLATKVNFEQEADAFMDLVAFGLKILVVGMVDRLEAGFRAMNNISWSTFEMVGEESAYLRSFQAILVDSMPQIRASLSPSYFSNFCTKLSSEILTR